MSENMATKLRRQVGGRNLVSKIVGYGLLGAIGIVFIFFGATGHMGMGLGSVARVNDSLISAADLDSEERRIQEYYSGIFGGSFDLGPQRNMLRQQAMETLIRSELASQGAQAEGIHATDSEVRDLIVRDIPAFQENGVFLRDRYLGYLQSMRMSAGDFESRLRKDIQINRIRQLFEASSYPNSLELEKIKELQGTKMNVQFAQIDTEKLSKEAGKVSAAEAQKALENPEFMKKAEEYFQAYKTDWSTPELVSAQHILVSAEAGDPASDQKALEKIKEIQGKLGKEDFGKLAAQYSDDPGSKTKKGQLEEFSRGKMVKEFEDAAFSQKIGEVGSPVKTQFGYHLIKVNSRSVAKNPAFAEVQTQVAERLLARDQMDGRMKELDAALEKGDGAAVDRLLAGMGVKWNETGLFDLAGAVPRVPPGAVAEAVFDLSKAQPLSKRAVRGEGGSRYVLKLKDFKQEAATLAARSDEMMQKRRAETLFNTWLEDFRKGSKVEVNPQVFR